MAISPGVQCINLVFYGKEPSSLIYIDNFQVIMEARRQSVSLVEGHEINRDWELGGKIQFKLAGRRE